MKGSKPLSSAEKYQNELKKIKNERYRKVLIIAKELFYEYGIENTTFNNIASEANVGVASVYRYFGNKPDLVIAVAELVAKDYIDWETKSFNSIAEDGSGLDKLRNLLMLFVELYDKDPGFICFLSDFDNYVKKEHIPVERLKLYDQTLLIGDDHFHECFKAGFKDGSIRKDIDADLIIKTMPISLITLSQKLLLSGYIVESDKNLRGKDHILCLVDMCLKSIS